MDQHLTIDQALGYGAEHHRAGRIAEAEKFYRLILATNPNHAEALHLLGLCAVAGGNGAAAADLVAKAIVIRPGEATYHANLGLILVGLGRIDEAARAYLTAIRLNPNLADAHNNIGILLARTDRLDDAIQAYSRAIQIKPDFAEAYNNLGNVLMRKGAVDQAIAAYGAAVRINPAYPEAHNNLGSALQNRGNLDSADAALARAIVLRPNLGGAYSNLGNLRKDQGRLDEALKAYRRAMELDPRNARTHSNLLHAMQFHPGCDARAILAEAMEYDRRHAAPLRQWSSPYGNDRSAERRLKIGYISPDFRDHCQNFFMRPLLANHDPQAVEIFCYSDVTAPDGVTGELTKYSHHWKSIVGMNDQTVADAIRADGMDILIDLTLHMAHNRLLVFARKPAPIQVTWLGYPGTTGLEAMDYRFTDPHLDPPENDVFYREKSIRLPDTFWCYDPGPTPDLGPLPALSAGRVTFGSLNNFAKVNQGVLELWERVLAAVPASRLILLSAPGEHRRPLVERFGERIQLAEPRPRNQYLDLYSRIDIVLDTVPYNGHTTSLDAFWMGAPVVTLVGDRVVGRAGLSLLTNLGLTDLIARTTEEYVQIATALAGDLPRLGGIRNFLRERMRTSPLMDGNRFARNVEGAYRRMWQTWIRQ